MTADQQQQPNDHTGIVIGYASNPKKKRQFFLPFAEHCMREHGVTCVDILEQQQQRSTLSLPIDVLFMKVTDDMCNRETDEDSAHRLSLVESYIEQHRSEVLVVEDMVKVERLLDRRGMYQFLHESLERENLTNELDTPPFAVIGNASGKLNDRDHNIIRELHYPVICKTMVACGTRESHDMAIVFDREHMMQLVQHGRPIQMELPVIAQQFVNHDATLYKIYVIADTTFVQKRPSIRNFDNSERDSRYFNSQNPFASELTDSRVPKSKEFVTDDARFNGISSKLRRAMQIDLFGYDCLIDSKTNKCLIVDINYLPGYNGVNNLFDRILQHLKQRVEEFRETNPEALS